MRQPRSRRFWKVKVATILRSRSGAAGRMLWTCYQLFFDERSFEGDIVKAFGGGRRHRPDECAVPDGRDD